jgi:hypothetical protein
VNAVELAREVNARIYDVVAKYGDDVEIDFVCSCGCMALAPCLPGDYAAAGGAWRDGHESRSARARATVNVVSPALAERGRST